LYYSHQLRELGYTEKQIRSWINNDEDLRKIYFFLKDEEYKKIHDEKNKEKEEEMRAKRRAEQQALSNTDTPESEDYYKALCIENNVDFDIEEYKGLTFKAIYVKVANQYNFVVKPYKPVKTKKSNPNNTEESTSHQAPVEIKPEQPKCSTEQKRNAWADGKGKTHENNGNSRVIKPKHQDVDPTKNTHNNGPKSGVVEDNREGESRKLIGDNKDDNFNYEKMCQQKLYSDFIILFKQKIDDQNDNPINAWNEYKKERQKRLEDHVHSAPERNKDASKARIPDFVAGCKWYNYFDQFVIENFEEFAFASKNDAYEYFTKRVKIQRTTELWKFDGEQIIKDANLTEKDLLQVHLDDIVDLLNRIRNDRKFQDWAKSCIKEYRTPDILKKERDKRNVIKEEKERYDLKEGDKLQSGLIWYQYVEDFFGYNFRYFRFENEREARTFAYNCEWHDTQMLWPGDEEEWMQTAGRITPEHAYFIADILDNDLFKNEKFQLNVKTYVTKFYGEEQYKKLEKIAEERKLLNGNG
jgi:hypothetical protein